MQRVELSSLKKENAELETKTETETETLPTNPSEKPKHQQEEFETTIPELKSPLTLEEVIIPSLYKGKTPEERRQYILNLFNQGVRDSAVTTTVFPGRGQRIARDQFILAHRNEVPELVGFNQRRIARAFTPPGNVTEIVRVVEQNESFYGMHGTYVLNVPVGKYAKAFTGNNIPLIYGDGTHVIHDPTFSFNPDNGFISQSDAFIQHDIINILRIPAGKYAKIWIGSDPYILRSSQGKQLWVFKDPLFRLETIGPSPYASVDATYISHGTNHILRVPGGKLACVWDASKPYLLESRHDAYETTSPLFKLQKNEANNKNNENYLISTTEKLIVHGSIKRIMPDTSEVAVAYDNGNLVIIKPTQDNKPTIKDSPTFKVETEFLKTSMQTEVFPSARSRAERRAENENTPPDEINYEVFTTKDGLKIGVKLLVAYEVTDPELAIRRLGDKEKIVGHIENLAAVDMGKVIQQRTAQDFLSFDHNIAKKANEMLGKGDLIQDEVKSIQDTVKKELGKDLESYGLNLVRLNFETPKILNEVIAGKMSQQSLVTAEVNAEEATIEKVRDLKLKKAGIEANNIRIQQEQTNANTVSIAKAANEKAKLEAEGTITRAKAAAEARVVEAKGEADSILLKAKATTEANEMLGKVYAQYNDLVKLEMAQRVSDGIKNSHLYVTPSDISGFYGNSMSLSLFSKDIGAGNLVTQRNNVIGDQEEEKNIPQGISITR